jgi:hypothetical protein
MKKFIPLLIVVVATTLTYVAITTHATAYGLLSKEPLDVIINGPPVNFTADQQDIDIQVDPTDPLPANGTVSISTLGATDSDMNGFPPLGVSVIIQNDTVTVTNQPITLGNPAPAPSTGDGDGGGDEGGD